MYPIIYSFGLIKIYSHGLMMVLGIIFGGFILYQFIKKEKMRTDLVMEILIYSVLAGFLGAKLLFIILYSNRFDNIFYLINGGMVSFGGMAGGLVATILVLKNKKQNILKWLDISSIALMLGWAIGRIGCFLNGDSLGIPTLSILGIWGRFPTPLFESMWLLLISGVCFWLYQKNKNRWLPGTIFSLAIGLYGFGRFFIDSVKDESIWFWQLKYGQIGALILIISALLIFDEIKRISAKK